MQITLNAISLRPGGGLTVLCGLVQSLHAARPAWQINVLTGSAESYQAVKSLGCAGQIELVKGKSGSLSSLLWQNLKLGKKVAAGGTDVLLSFNHFLLNVPCGQVVYHLNLRRFIKLYRSRRPIEIIKESLRDWFARRALTHAQANVFESQYLMKAAEDAVDVPILYPEVVYIGLPDELLEIAESRIDQQRCTEYRVVAITSPQEHKDNATLIRMLAVLRSKDPSKNWQLDIAGGIDELVWQPLREFAKREGVLDAICWHGFCDNDKLTELLNRAQCLVATSQLESFAMVPIEAMARGCPPVVADCTSMPESVGSAGLLASPGDATSFADEVQRIAMDPELRKELVEKGYKWIRNFLWSECGQSFARLIEGVVARNAIWVSL